MVEIIDNDLYAQNARNCQLSGDQKSKKQIMWAQK